MNHVGWVTDIQDSVDFYNGSWYFRNDSGDFLPWNGSIEALCLAKGPRQLEAMEIVSLVSGIRNISGEFSFYIAYSTQPGQFNYNLDALAFVVTD